MIYATIFCKSFYRDGVRTSVELVPVHSTNHSATAASKEHCQYVMLRVEISNTHEAPGICIFIKRFLTNNKDFYSRLQLKSYLREKPCLNIKFYEKITSDGIVEL